MKTYTVYGVRSGAELVYIGCTSKAPEDRLSGLRRSFKDHPGPFSVHALHTSQSAEDASQREQELYNEHRPYYNGSAWTAKYRTSRKATTNKFLLRFATLEERDRLHDEAKARKWSLQTYLTHLVQTHQDRAKKTNPEEGD